MESRHVSLLGLMGSGKSTVGERLARRLGLPLVDTDAAIARAHGPIPEIFRERGEAVFRDFERAALADALAGPRAVVSPGGGAVTHGPSRALLARTVRIYLRVPIPVLLKRLRQSTTVRPLLGTVPDAGRLADLYEARRAWYEEAEIVVDADRPIEGVVGDLVARLAGPSSPFVR